MGYAPRLCERGGVEDGGRREIVSLQKERTGLRPASTNQLNDISPHTLVQQAWPSVWINRSATDICRSHAALSDRHPGSMPCEASPRVEAHHRYSIMTSHNLIVFQTSTSTEDNLVVQ
jgi:hypothetical protein